MICSLIYKKKKFRLYFRCALSLLQTRHIRSLAYLGRLTDERTQCNFFDILITESPSLI